MKFSYLFAGIAIVLFLIAAVAVNVLAEHYTDDLIPSIQDRP